MIGQVIALIDNAIVTLQAGGNPADAIGMLTQARDIAEQVEKQSGTLPATTPQAQRGRTPVQQAQAALGGRMQPTVPELAREIYAHLQMRPQGGTTDDAYELAEKFLAGPSQQFVLARQQNVQNQSNPQYRGR